MAYDFSKLKGGIKDTEEWLGRELAGVRTGRATPTLLDGVKPEVYGARTPMNQVGSVSIEDARTLRIIPWDKDSIKAIEKAITEADLGVGTAVDDQGVRVTFPELTGERRTLLTKLANEKHEQAKVTLRGHRTDAIKELDELEKGGGIGKDDVKRLKDEVQKLIDAGNAALDAAAKKKAEEIAN
jgi:ribosome recycling factor